MKKTFHFLFYCSYCLILKSDGTVMERASFLVSTSTSFISISLYLLFVVSFNIPFVNPLLIFPIVISLFLANGLLTSKYFVKSGRYLEIINSYSRTSSATRKIYGMIAALLFLGSVALFIFSGITTSKYLNHW